MATKLIVSVLALAIGYRRRGRERGCLARCMGILFMFSFDELCLVDTVHADFSWDSKGGRIHNSA